MAAKTTRHIAVNDSWYGKQNKDQRHDGGHQGRHRSSRGQRAIGAQRGVFRPGPPHHPGKAKHHAQDCPQQGDDVAPRQLRHRRHLGWIAIHRRTAQFRFHHEIGHQPAHQNDQQRGAGGEIVIAQRVDHDLLVQQSTTLLGQSRQQGIDTRDQEIGADPPETPAKAAAIPANGCRPAA